MSLNYTVPPNWTGFNDAVYPFNLTIHSTGDSLVNTTLSGNITVRATLLSSMLWVQIQVNAIDSVFDNLTRGGLNCQAWDFYHSIRGGDCRSSCCGQWWMSLRSLEQWVDRAQEDVNMAVAILNGTLLAAGHEYCFEFCLGDSLAWNLGDHLARNATSLAAVLMLAAKQDIDQLLEGMAVLNWTSRTGVGDAYLQIESQGFDVKVLLSQMSDKLVPNPLLNVNIALAYLQANLTSTIRPSVAGDLITRLAAAQNAIDGYQIRCSLNCTMRLTLVQLNQFTREIQQDIRRDIIKSTYGNAILAQVNQLLAVITALHPVLPAGQYCHHLKSESDSHECPLNNWDDVTEGGW